ncbi:MAG TPA: polyprenyl synthetase family protein [Candidatus Omnitrophota bacterium]|nr:polyprenyl synthetase family protein [Candidatus Omnitrophota bacterium]HPS36155.1 polyprenyl synthetase family protein [Candidatus Omnitrophota bacterium]
MKTTLTLDEIYAPINEPLKRVPTLILETLNTPIPKMRGMVDHFFSKSGKLLRPALIFLGAGLSRSSQPGMGIPSERNETAELYLAVAVEIFHAATLIHDDIIDSAPLRRGVAALHIKAGPQAAVLAGDFFHDRAVAVVFRHGNDRIFPLFLKTAGEICEGEVQEISEKKNINMTEEAHLEIVRKKTASLLACALQTGALIWGLGPERCEALSRFGTFFGMAFQIIDDYLDFAGQESEFGKTLGSDLEEGVYTLPVIHCLASEERDKVVRILYSRSYHRRFSMLREVLEKSGALAYAFAKARALIAMAKRELEVFPPSCFRTSLEQLADYVVERNR